MLAAAKKWEAPAAIASWAMPRNPFQRPWGLQVDGGLWKLAWDATLSRGSEAQKTMKVKGHSTKGGVVNGTTEHRDGIGNNNAGALAEYGVEEIGGKQMLKIARWLSQRHDVYMKFMVNLRSYSCCSQG